MQSMKVNLKIIMHKGRANLRMRVETYTQGNGFVIGLMVSESIRAVTVEYMKGSGLEIPSMVKVRKVGSMGLLMKVITK